MSEATRIRTLVKQCRCRATSSGPRIIIHDAKPYGPDRGDGKPDVDTVEVTVEYVEFACDGCDKPWKETP